LISFWAEKLFKKETNLALKTQRKLFFAITLNLFLIIFTVKRRVSGLTEDPFRCLEERNNLKLNDWMTSEVIIETDDFSHFSKKPRPQESIQSSKIQPRALKKG